MTSSIEGSAPNLLQLLADPQRWVLLQELAASDRRVGELTALTGKPQNLVSYHLRALRSAGIVTARRSAADGRDTYYRVDLERCSDVLSHAGRALHPGVRLAPAQPPPADRPRRRRVRVLFICTGNSARSQIAAALLDSLSGHSIEARSAGTHPKALHPNAVRVLAERGIDISGNSTTPVSRYARTRFDQVITLCDKAKEECQGLGDGAVTAHWSMSDPSAAGGSDEATYPSFERTAEEIEVRVRFLIAQLTAASRQEGSTHADR